MHTNTSISIKHEAYPHLLRNIYNPPQKLFYRGNISALEKTCISIVGTRKYTEYGEFVTQKLISEISHLDIAIVSGLAKGIDAIAHESALENDLPTIAVLGNGIDYIYPHENTSLATQITKNGLVLSEYSENTEPKSYHFPMRNRIVSGISVLTIVIEAPEKSGALITANFALEQGRDIAVVPGDIDRTNSKGILQLLQKGAAYPIASGQDIINLLQQQPHLPLSIKTKKESSEKTPKTRRKIPIFNYKLTEKEQRLFNNLNKYRGLSLDELNKKTKLPMTEILAGMSILEMNNLVKMRHNQYLRNEPLKPLQKSPSLNFTI